MAVKSAVEFAAQQAQAADKSRVQDNRRAAGTRQKGNADGASAPAKAGETGMEDVWQEDSVQYESPDRANAGAAWFQEYLRRQQMEKFGLDFEEEDEEKEEKDPARENGRGREDFRFSKEDVRQDAGTAKEAERAAEK